MGRFTDMIRLLIILSPFFVAAVDRSKFKSCSQSGFCTRCRNTPAFDEYALDISTLNVTPESAEVLLKHNEILFRVHFNAVKGGIFRMGIREAYPSVSRFEVPEVLLPDLISSPITLVESSPQGFVLESEKSRVRVKSDPFTAEFFSDGILVLTANARGLLRFEHTREKDESRDDGTGAWEESFGGHSDTKPRGPQAIALDFRFVNTNHVYGIPEHADRFSLQDTSSGEPYRLYNLDVFEYEVWNTMALYAAVPFMMGHNSRRTTGLFWLNAAETWIDVKKSSSGSVMDSISSLVSSFDPFVDTHWMSEAGIIDIFVLPGPSPKEVSGQYAALTGPTPLPPLFSIAYHQCRWNYNDQEDVKQVAEKFDDHDIPMDVMWLDIEHTDKKKYFTWDPNKFSEPYNMVDNLSSKGRKLVTIVDPHIKKESGYWVHEEITSLGLYTKKKDGSDYEGWCWPGASYYPDFLKPEARDYFAKQYAFDKYLGTSNHVFTWNDMNEPSVFNGPEVTMPKDLLHANDVEHREMHNMYGHLYVMGTNKGHLLRSDYKYRPFILTRSGFAGTHRYAAIWTGDNTADWSHVEASVPMCLSLGIAGFSHCGSDVGGFFNNPDGKLFTRWYQAAAYQPFFRSHAHIDTRRREPWLFPEHLNRIKIAIRERYALLPYWYTLFYESELSGVPPMRPLLYEFPEDESVFSIDTQHMVGEGIMVKTIYEPDVESVTVVFPKGALWYDARSLEKISPDTTSVSTTEDGVPVFYRGGTIIPKKLRPRRSSKLMENDPYTLYVSLNENGKAKGSLYIDDGETLDYRNGKFVYMDLIFEDNKLVGATKFNPGLTTKSWLERVVILGLQSSPKTVTVSTPNDKVNLISTFEKSILTIRKPGVGIADDWVITLS